MIARWPSRSSVRVRSRRGSWRQSLRQRGIETVASWTWHQMRYPEPIEPEAAIQVQQESLSGKASCGERLLSAKGCRRIATRHDRLAWNFLASTYLVATIAWWILRVLTLGPVDGFDQDEHASKTDNGSIALGG